ncbi:uncharacterized protein LOC116841105 [Odontomachus brunneus]|uniref:uncharacterized protein LOC116841105 n=1 Tax=Odontomachus brunneus TaxID=486640 RepID=UPI0013F2AA5E|nr:uncharacterized protein LOC116841105 [Odontomachus brunneus]
MSKEGRFSSHELQQYRERLIKQKEFLTDILSKIEKQILALQVERLHLRNSLFGAECTGQAILPDSPDKSSNVKIEPMNDVNPQDFNKQQLDLSVPISYNNFEEETEDDEMSENEKIIEKKLDLMDY